MKKTQNKSGAKPIQHKTSSKLDLLPTFIFTGVLAIAVAITVPVVLSQSSGLADMYNFTFTGTHCAIDGHESYSEQIKKDETNVEFVISSNDENYIMPKAMEGLPEGISYSQTNNNEAKITIGKMDKDYIVDMSAVDKMVRFRLKGENCLIDGKSMDFIHSERYTIPTKEDGTTPMSWSITASGECTLPEEIKSLPDCLSYQRTDNQNATVSFISALNDHTVVTISGINPAGSYSFTFSGEYCSLNNATEYPAGAKPELTLTADANYRLPDPTEESEKDNFVVTMGGKALHIGDDYIYIRNSENTTAIFAFIKEGITGDVEVTAVATPS